MERIWKIYEKIKSLEGFEDEFVALLEEALLRLLNFADLARDI